MDGAPKGCILSFCNRFFFLGKVKEAVEGFWLGSPRKHQQNHRLMDSLRMEKTSKTPTSNPNPPHHTTVPHIPQCHIPTALDHLQGWRPPNPPNSLGSSASA